MKVLPGDIQKLASQGVGSFPLYHSRSDATGSITESGHISFIDLANYVTDLENKLIRLAAKVADSL